jgi:hypothetical protein
VTFKLHRRQFLSWTSGTLLSLTTPRIFSSPLQTSATQSSSSCWLDVCGAFVVEDSDLGVHSEIVLTSDTFVGRKGFEDGLDKTDYEIYLYDSSGNPIGKDGVAWQRTVPAMQTTVVRTADLIGPGKKFWGGVKVRLRPASREPMHASDLFSSAFVRWRTADSFDNVHANPDPLEWQRSDTFFYSMPFPPLGEYNGIFSLFNPYTIPSTGLITLYSDLGVASHEIPYLLQPHSSLLLDLRKGKLINQPDSAFRLTPTATAERTPSGFGEKGGTIAITNQKGSVKNFGYLVTRSEGRQRFSVEHPIHQQTDKPLPVQAPFDAEGRFKAKNILYTPLVFHSHRIGSLTLRSRFHFSSGAPVEEALWLKPLITAVDGTVKWQPTPERGFPQSVSPTKIERGALRLATCQSCILDTAELDLGDDFAGGLALAVAPNTNHTLMKVEIAVSPWEAHAFTHFRPGLRSARLYQQSQPRGGLGTDYVVTNARLERSGRQLRRDELIGVINIDDKGVVGEPVLEVFGSGGLLERIKLGKVPAFGASHLLLSELLSTKSESIDLTLRLVDDQATLLMSVVHLDYVRKDLALDHGSDRFSTFNEFRCSK